MLKISIGVTGEKEFKRKIGVTIANVEDLRPAWDEIQKAVEGFQKKVFLGKGSAGGLPKWKDLADSTKKAKMRSRYAQWSTYPLIRTQTLMNAWTKDGAEGAVRVKEKLFFAFGINEYDIPYSQYHQIGRGVPKREHLRLPKSLRNTISKIVQEYLDRTGQLIRRNVFR